MKINEEQMQDFLKYLNEDKKVETRLGTFYLRKRKANMTPDLQGKMRKRPARKYIHYKPTQSIKEIINEKDKR